MSRPILLLAACAAAACSTSGGSRPNDRAELQPSLAVDSIPLRHAGVDLTGAWASGSGGEPAAQRLTVRPQCNYTPALWVIQQAGDSVRAWAIPEHHAQGIRTTSTVSSAAAVGRVSGVDVTMTIADSRYLLRYDSTSGHLRGTLNGAPFWAVRQDVVRPERCIPVP
jgi:hypothetical protein